ncbi:MAG: tetratricopeptide repeat protein [Actinobacteria bacterium]|nr:tetratricopeptide repeat protein [Actinomycetota bacterium]
MDYLSPKTPKKSFIVYGAIPVLLAVAAMVAYYVIAYNATRTVSDGVKERSYEAYKAGDFDTAKTGLEDYLKDHDNDFEARSTLATCYVQLGETEKAFRETEAALELRPLDPDALYRAGCLAFDAERPEDAIAYLEKAIAAKPNTVQYHYRLADVYTETKNFRRAQAEWKNVLDLLPRGEPHAAEIHKKIGDIYMGIGVTRKAAVSYRKALAVNPDDAYAKERLSKAVR